MVSPHASPGTPVGASRADGSSFERVLEALERAGSQPRPRGTTHLDARCPAHEDHRPSLSVDWRDSADRGGLTVVCCQTGCSGDAVADALGLSLAELFDSWEPHGPFAGQRVQISANAEPRRPAPAPRPARPRRGWPKAGELQAVYQYVRAGELIGEVGRFVGPAGKTFRWRRPVADRPGFWLFEKPSDAPLYRHDNVGAAIAAGDPVYIVEGEKDADAAAAAGAVAVTKPNGACKRPEEWRPEWTATLAGALVVIVADRDEAGYRHAAIVAGALAAAAASVTTVRTPLEQDKADLSDHLAEALPLDRLEPVPAELLPAVPAPAAADRPGARVLPFPRQGGGPGGPGDGGAGASSAAAAPGYRIPMSMGSWKYSTGDGRDGFNRGVYRRTETKDESDAGEWSGWALVAPLPYVLERLSRRDGDGRRTGLDFRMAMSPDGTDAVVCDGDEVKMGEWAPRLDVALSADDKIVRAAATAIRDVAARFAPAREVAPRWVDGELHLPPHDVGPKGYGEAAGDDGAARQAWREIAEMAAANPKLALVLGTALGGPFMDPLNRKAFVYLMVGSARQGKTTGLLAAGALFGDPAHVVTAWNTTAVGLTAGLGELACLPAFRDELGASGMSPANLETLLFRLTQGAQRTTGKRLGGARQSASWRAPFITTGNVGVLGRMSNEGIAARVIEVSTPIVATAGEAERLEQLSRDYYGWPLRWMLAAGVDLDGFAAAVARAETDLAIASGGVARTLGQHGALAVAGAERLEALTGVAGIRAAAAAAAVAVLDGLVAELMERGIRPGERLLSAVVQAVASRPAAFPTLVDYARAAEGVDGRLPREVEGYTLDAFAGEQQIAVLTTHMDAIAAAAGMDDSLPGLRQLREEKLLVTSAESDGRLRKQVRIPGTKLKPSCYVFRIPDEPAAPEQAPPPPGPVHVEMQNSANAETQNSTSTEQAAPDQEPTPTVPAESAGSVAPPVPATRPARPAGTARQPAAAVLALRAAHLAVPGGERQVVVLPDGTDTLAALLSWGESMELGVRHPVLRKLDDDGQLWILPALAERIGLPASKPKDKAAASKLRGRLAVELEPHGWKVSESLGEHWWLYVYRPGGRGLRLVVPHWAAGPSDCPLLEDAADDAPRLAARIARYVEHTGTAWTVSGAATGLNLVERTRARAAVKLITPHDPPPPASAGRTMREADLEWQRQPDPAELGMTYVHGYDKNGMYLSAMSSVELGFGPAEHRQAPAFDPKVPAYWRIEPPEWQHARLPNWLDPRSRGLDGAAWLVTPSLAMAAQLGWWDGQVIEAYAWPDRVRYLEQAYKVLKPAREALKRAGAAGDADAAAVADAVKITYAGMVGKFAAVATRGDRQHLPYGQHAVMGFARMALLRKVAEVGEQTGRYPLAIATDHVLYASNDPDPISAAPPGLPLDPAGLKLGHFKPTGTASMAAAAPLLESGPRVNEALIELIEEGAR